MSLRIIPAALAASALLLALSGCAGVALGSTSPVLEPSSSVGGATEAGEEGVSGGAPTNPPTGPIDSADELGADDGFIAVGDRVALTDDVPAVTRLDPALREALERSAQAAAADGRDVQFTLVDGWRSARYQQYLFDQAVTKYGSESEAARWVKRPDESKHVLGEAVDLATADAMDWLNRFGGAYGLCQIYANEAWHFELAADASGTCPPQLTDGSAG